MKKQYMKPEMDIVEVKMQQLLAGSVSLSADEPVSGDADSAAGNELNFDMFNE